MKNDYYYGFPPIMAICSLLVFLGMISVTSNIYPLVGVIMVIIGTCFPLTFLFVGMVIYWIKNKKENNKND